MARRWMDIALTIVLITFGLSGTGPAAQNEGMTVPPVAYALIVAAALPILVWRRWPLWTFVLTSSATQLYLALVYPYGPIMITQAVVVLGTALRLPVRRTLVAMAALLALDVVVIAIGVLGSDRNAAEFVSNAAWLVLPAAIGVAIKTRRDAARDVRTEQSRRAASEERLHLAQEVHDVAGHGFAVIAMQAGVALRVLDRDPAAARAALEAIRSTSRAALDSLRAEVEAIQRGPDRAQAPLSPDIGLADLTVLADRIRSGGLPVTLEGLADIGDVPTDVSRAAYRIVQESLTNVLRHAGSDASVRVALHRDDGRLHIDVTDDGPGVVLSETSGQGIAGMRARAETLGGTIHTGPLPAGGFGVHAMLPLSAGAS